MNPTESEHSALCELDLDLTLRLRLVERRLKRLTRRIRELDENRYIGGTACCESVDVDRFKQLSVELDQLLRLNSKVFSTLNSARIAAAVACRVDLRLEDR